jgi:hypothetical protein
MGVCYVVANVPEALEKYDAGVFPSQSLVYPYEDVSAYFSEFEHRDINIYYGSAGPIDKSTSAIVQPPKHGILVDAGRGKYQTYYYKPDAGYFGNDSAVIEAEVNGLKGKINYYFHSLDTKAFSESVVCGKKGLIWKISQDGNGTPTLTAVSYQSPTTSIIDTTGNARPTGWNTQGSVEISPSTSSGGSTGSPRTTAPATLNEMSGIQTRLNQVVICE